MPYLTGIYSFQDNARAAAAAEGMNSMERDGWTIHTAIPNYTELSVLWYKPLDSASAPDDGSVHVDWRLTPEESEELFGVLRQHPDVPYVAALLASGAVPPAPEEVSQE
jgi:hypothetical protein